MSVYNDVRLLIDDMDIGEMTVIDKPEKLNAFRKFLSEISARDFKKFTTKIKNNKLHILRVDYYSIPKEIENI